MDKKRVLIVYYTYTHQTKVQLRHFIAGLEGAGIEVTQERLTPITPYEFPFKTFIRLATAMVVTSFQKRMTIAPVAARCVDSWDCIVLAGPTWSYNPSGPMLDFLDRYGREVCGGKRVVPLISCRAYWRLHFWTIKKAPQPIRLSGRKPDRLQPPGQRTVAIFRPSSEAARENRATPLFLVSTTLSEIRPQRGPAD